MLAGAYGKNDAGLKYTKGGSQMLLNMASGGAWVVSRGNSPAAVERGWLDLADGRTGEDVEEGALT